MRAVRWHARGDVRLEDVPDPTPLDPHDVVLAVEACGVCGTDVEEVQRGPLAIPADAAHPLTGRKAPIVMGHEIVGRVVAAGPNAPFPIGARLVPSPVIGCGACRACRAGYDQRCERLGVVGLSADGGMAEFVRVDGRRCVPVAEEIPAERAALAEPYAVAVHALEGAEIRGSRVAVIGVGSVGRCVTDLVRLREAAEIVAVDPRVEAREEAEALGATGAILPEEAGAVGADVVIEASGAERGLATAVEAAAVGGLVIAVGFRAGEVPCPLPALVLGEVRIRGSVGHLLSEFAQAADLVSRRLLGALGRAPDQLALDDAPGILCQPPDARGGAKMVVRP